MTTLFDEGTTDEIQRPPLNGAGLKYVCAIDPGLDGAIVLLPGDPDVEPIRFVMPTVELKQKVKGKQKVKRQYDLPALRQILTGYNIASVFIETQQAQTKPVPWRCRSCNAVVAVGTPQGIVSTFTTGRGFGLLEGLCAGIPIRYELVHPRSWQPKLLAAGSGDSKGRALLAAKALFPMVDLRANDRCRVPHEGIVDAMLLAEFGRRRLGGTIAPEDLELGF